jgi:CheY-like chemotaxis protein
MDDPPSRILILDSDPDTLITLQHVLEHAEVDTTITWDEIEARQLLEKGPFDLVLIGDHPPELDAAAIVHDLTSEGTTPPILILRAMVYEKDFEYFRGLGAIDVVPTRDPIAVLDQVRRGLALTGKEARRKPLPWPRPVRGERSPESRRESKSLRRFSCRCGRELIVRHACLLLSQALNTMLDLSDG